MNKDEIDLIPNSSEATATKGGRYSFRSMCAMRMLMEIIPIGGADPMMAEEKARIAVLHADALLTELAKQVKPMSERTGKKRVDSTSPKK